MLHLVSESNQIPPLRCGMTNKRTDNGKNNSKGQYGDSGCARMTTRAGCAARPGANLAD
jgi:hypothetical protein